MRELLAEAAGDILPASDAPEFAELLLAFTRGLEADLAHPGLATERLRRGVALLVAGLGRTPDPTHAAHPDMTAATPTLQETS